MCAVHKYFLLLLDIKKAERGDFITDRILFAFYCFCAKCCKKTYNFVEK